MVLTTFQTFDSIDPDTHQIIIYHRPSPEGAPGQGMGLFKGSV